MTSPSRLLVVELAEELAQARRAVEAATAGATAARVELEQVRRQRDRCANQLAETTGELLAARVAKDAAVADKQILAAAVCDVARVPVGTNGFEALGVLDNRIRQLRHATESRSRPLQDVLRLVQEWRNGFGDGTFVGLAQVEADLVAAVDAYQAATLAAGNTPPTMYQERLEEVIAQRDAYRIDFNNLIARFDQVIAERDAARNELAFAKEAFSRTERLVDEYTADADRYQAVDDEVKRTHELLTSAGLDTGDPSSRVAELIGQRDRAVARANEAEGRYAAANAAMQSVRETAKECLAIIRDYGMYPEQGELRRLVGMCKVHLLAFARLGVIDPATTTWPDEEGDRS